MISILIQAAGIDPAAICNMLAQTAEMDLDGPWKVIQAALPTVEQEHPGVTQTLLAALQDALVAAGQRPTVNL